MIAVLRRLAIERVGGLALLVGLTLLRLLTDLGAGAAVATELYLLAVTGVVLAWCVRALAATESRERLRKTTPYGRRRLLGRPEHLVALEDAMPYWIDVAGLRYYRLRPEVRAAAADRLTRMGIDLRTDPRAQVALGRTVWELIRTDVPPPQDGKARGLSPAQVQELTAKLEALERPDFPVPPPSGEQL